MPEFTAPQLLALARDALSSRPKMYKKGGTVEHKGVSITHAELSPQAVDGGAVFHPEHLSAGGTEDSAFIPHGDQEREQNLLQFMEGNHPDVPHVAYHGTADNIHDEFRHEHQNKKDAGWLGKGFYFSNNTGLANSYAALKAGSQPNVMPVHLSMKNPYHATMKDKERIMLALRRGEHDAPENFTNSLIEKGHDGVILDYGMKDNTKELVAFHPHQIKSATGNRGTFDPKNPDITKARGGEVPHMPHPAMRIPGVHIVTSEAGEPFFHG